MGPESGAESGEIAGSRHSRLPWAAAATAAAALTAVRPAARLSCLLSSSGYFPEQAAANYSFYSINLYLAVFSTDKGHIV